MGYTHYYAYDPNAAEFIEGWTQAVDDVRAIVAYATDELGIGIGDAFGDGEPEITEQRIALNGRRRGGHDHETLLIHGPNADARRAIEEQKQWFGDVDYVWAFCKTARKPYDIAVTSVLLRFGELMPNAFVVSSDGSWAEEWQHGAGAWPGSGSRGIGPVAVVRALFDQIETPERSRLGAASDGPPCASGRRGPSAVGSAVDQ